MTKPLPFDYSIRRSSRVKNVRIVVKHNNVEVVAPPGFPDRRLHTFVMDKQAWIIGHLEKLQKQHTEKKFAPEEYTDGAQIPLLGKFYRLNLKQHNELSCRVELGQNIDVWLPEMCGAKLVSDTIRCHLEQWMRTYAADLAQKLVDKHGHLYGLKPRSILIKAQKSRWGSCGIHNDINLNWVLIMAPEAVFEYVVVHELCHLKHRNHSADFWALVAEHIPDYQRHRKWLKDNGSALLQGL